ncbi:hypothetical protein AB0L88_24740 [Saccharopolyspora shandongensis]|uniref:Uncharacterized protein n=1 Tax=Saccharopolyspora shandongensis TaxID=418495 RepID=A0A1H3T5E5_9PSEU|nr:hypothetical protein [Saccharopolyspora shandongensis]SDZ45071.1 hypothetical protein SAMN05216215_107514 [Saccharopolyspora shandongensis]
MRDSGGALLDRSFPGGLLAAAVLVSGCTSLAGQSASTPPGLAVGVASAGGAASSESGAGADVMASDIHAVDIAVDLEFAENGGGWMVSYVEGKWDGFAITK